MLRKPTVQRIKNVQSNVELILTLMFSEVSVWKGNWADIVDRGDWTEQKGWAHWVFSAGSLRFMMKNLIKIILSVNNCIPFSFL